MYTLTGYIFFTAMTDGFPVGPSASCTIIIDLLWLRCEITNKQTNNHTTVSIQFAMQANICLGSRLNDKHTYEHWEFF